MTDGQTYAMSHGYNRAGAQTSMTYPSGRVIETKYDVAGRMAGVKDQQSGIYYAGAVESDATNRIQYASHGAVKVMKLGNGLWEHTDFNNRLQSTQIGLGASGTDSSMIGLTYNYGTTNNNGNLQSVGYSGGGLSYTQTFGYDHLNRLTTSVESGTSWSQSNSYDRYGNRSIVGAALSFSASNNRITNAGYVYDAPGNLTNDGSQSFAFDAEKKIKTVNGEGDVYRYDGDGSRVRKNFTFGEKVRMVYGGAQLIAEYDLSNGTLKKEYVYGAKGLIATIEPANGTRYTTADHLGTPRVVTNSSAGVVSRHDYMPFGEEIGAGIGGRTTGMGFSVADGLRQKFTSKERDSETGLDYFEARYYGSTQGRFISVDLVAGSLSNPQSLNRYSYVLNNPLKFIDPTGMIVEWADSEKKKKKNETEARTSAQRKYEKHIAHLLESKKSEERARGERLQESYQRLKDSKATFRVVSEDSGSSSGELSFNGKVFIVSLKGNANEYGAIDTNQKIAHEFEHGRQVLDRELSYHNFNPPDWKSWALDRTDEAKAFAAGFDATPVGPAQGSFLTGMRQAVQNGGIQKGVDYLGRSNTRYRYLRSGPVDVTHRSPAIYEVPK